MHGTGGSGLNLSWYRLLDLPPDASRGEIQRAFEERAKELHRRRVFGTPDEALAADRAMTVLQHARRSLAATGAPAQQGATPDLHGMRFSESLSAASLAGLRLKVVRLTERPAPVDGLVIDQYPVPGARTRAGGTVTVRVWHPPSEG
jgi:hypothetical protein